MSSGAVPIPVVRGAPAGAWSSDERLARLAGAGDERAFAAIYQRHHQRLFRYCLSILRSEVDAQDALQSTFERALGALVRGQRTAPLRPWLFRIAHNEAITVIRRRGPEPVAVPDDMLRAHSAEHEAAQRQELSALVADLQALPLRARSALVMRELEGLSHEDIALALETSVGAAKQAIFDARQGLAELAEGRAVSCDEIRRQVSDGDGRVLRGRRVRAHLSACATCAEFAAGIGSRRERLRALAPPLAPAAAAALLARLGGGASGNGVSGAAGAGGLGKGALASAIGGKVAVGAAVIATATVSVAGVTALHPFGAHHRVPGADRARARALTVSRPSGDRSFAAAEPRSVRVASVGATARGRATTRGGSGAGRVRSVTGSAGASAATGATGHGSSARGGGSAAHGRSAQAPGHAAGRAASSATAHGRSAQAPGHSSSTRGTSSRGHGRRSHGQSGHAGSATSHRAKGKVTG